MKKMLKLLSCSLLVISVASGCNTKTIEEDVFQYKNAYVGDNSAVINIVNHSMQSDKFRGLELKTKETPYGIILNYDGSESEKNDKRTVIYNATYLFALIQNAEWITFNFKHQEYKITKDALIEWYGEDFSTLQSEEELKTLIQNNWDDEYRVNQLF
ncbi:DUF4825 domain-containing protein [Psychrobacter sp. YGAH215]|uniref:DUF4825 domain-containing protein n=1 Tax=Psychrobacter sp. YGAH215 TaxID=2596826 RepID=UPI001186E990|nr:DUF4825 domain-containing protein [Psychrobacter sp. YGAH215]TSB24442.1 DUF4825 domain-containing protein [Psychrobacter sp. YGAH215]